jgi:hypothetical protein
MLMKNGMVSVTKVIMLMVAMGALTGCSNGETQARDAATGRAGSRGAQLAPYGIGEREVLRVRTDLVRGRLWVLGLDNVYVYEFATRRLVRKISLANWFVSRFDCKPDLALDHSGSAWISSNAQSRLWRIDASDFTVSDREIRLRERDHWDVGFGALAFGADGALFALTATAGGSLWKIDPREASASPVELGLPPVKVCELADLFGAIAAGKDGAGSQPLQK